MTARFRGPWITGAALVMAGVSLVLAALWLHTRLASAALFLRMEGGNSGPDWLVHYGERQVEVRPFALASGARALLYVPRDVARPAGVVLAHGIHQQGIHEPRFRRLAHAVASSGLMVLTPELADLVRYRVSRVGVETIGGAARDLAKSVAQRGVAVFGISFGGGLALRAACEPALRGAIERVIALGAHHDASAVARFFLGEGPRGPDGPPAAPHVLRPHSYGGTILFAWLFDEAHQGPLRSGDRERVRAALTSRKVELDAASPAACRQPVSVPLHLAHGLGDDIVPATETLWNSARFAATAPVEVLISPVLGHAAYAPPTLWQRFQLLNFMAKALP